VSAPAILRQSDAERILIAARKAGFRSVRLKLNAEGSEFFFGDSDAPDLDDASVETWSDDDR